MSVVILNVSDIDECTEYDAICDQRCDNIIGSYRCSCEDGYMLNETTGHNCVLGMSIEVTQISNKSIPLHQLLIYMLRLKQHDK